jgi:hypothetical protein
MGGIDMQAQTETLPRMKLSQVAEALEPEREELARAAAEVLGYKKMAQVLTVPNSLAYVLRKLEIEPLVPSSVLAYKKSKEKTGVWSARWRGLILLPVAVLSASLTGLLAWNGIQCLIHLTNIFGWLVGIVGGVGGAAITVPLSIYTFSCLLGDTGRGTRSIHSWERISISGYNGNIPEFALNKAVQIKMELPKVKLSIDALTVQREEDKKKESAVVEYLRDPFLVAELGTEIFYIDVWDEKEYERKM